MACTSRQQQNISNLTISYRTKTAFLTLELQLHHVKEGVVGPSSSDRTEVYRSLAHRNPLTTSLGEIAETHLASQEKKKPKSDVPSWTREVLSQPSSDNTDPPPKVLYLLPKHSQQPPQISFHSLDPTQSLGENLRNKRFIEWPVIHIWLEEDFEGEIVGREREAREPSPPPPKRRKLNADAGKKLLSGLVGKYDSDEEAEDSDEGADADADGEAEGVFALMEYGSDDDPPLLAADGTWQVLDDGKLSLVDNQLPNEIADTSR